MREGQEDGPERGTLVVLEPEASAGSVGTDGSLCLPSAAPSTQLTPTFGQQRSMSQGGWAAALEGISLPACL